MVLITLVNLFKESIDGKLTGMQISKREKKIMKIYENLSACNSPKSMLENLILIQTNFA